nr:uncharacterized protein LOC111425646 [Onthophagus taurus]
MNALYVTVSVPILLLLAGFNHAHGLSTFGRSPTVPPISTPQLHAKDCTTHDDCKGMNGTSCVEYANSINKLYCLCGNNQPPRNGVCPTVKKEPFHICNKDDDCVDGSSCKMSNSVKANLCLCDENQEARDCNSGFIKRPSTFAVLLGSLLFFVKIFG